MGFDIGGTFTDVVLFDSADETYVYHKLPSTPGDVSRAAIDGVGEILKLADHDAVQLSSIRHGTTVATNAVIEGAYAKTALITTAGFRDILELARQVRPHLYELDREKPNPVVPRGRRYEVGGRVGATGEILERLDDARLNGIIEDMRVAAVGAVAVCFLHAYANDEHELEVAEILRTAFPETLICTSSEVANEFREYERFCSTVVNASLMPVISSYLGKLVAGTSQIGATVAPEIMQSNGGLMSPAQAMKRPISTFLSGPAAGVVGAISVAARAGVTDFITFDMGGTSTDVCLIQQGRVAVRREQQIAGVPVKTPTVDIHTVGAGGGSIAWIDPGGLLRVGPASARAVPGPACYGRGGTEPTLSDANVLLGRLSAEALLGGRMPIDVAAAQAAVLSRVGTPLGLDAHAAAAGILKIATANVVQAIRTVSVERGHDPRNFALLAFGGAGPMHAAEIARELGIPSVVIPSRPGLLCAEGLLSAETRREFSRTRIFGLDSDSARALADLLAGLRAQLEQWLAEEDLRESDLVLTWSADLRYRGQDFELEIELDEARVRAGSLDELRRDFHAAYERAYGYSKPDRAVEFVTGRLAARVPAAERPEPELIVEDGASQIGQRPVWFEGARWVATPVHRRERLAAGASIAGPAVIDQMDSTTIVLPDMSATVHPSGALLLTW